MRLDRLGYIPGMWPTYEDVLGVVLGDSDLGRVHELQERSQGVRVKVLQRRVNKVVCFNHTNSH